LEYDRNGVRTSFRVRHDRAKVFTIGCFGRPAVYGNAAVMEATFVSYSRTRRRRAGGTSPSEKFWMRYGIHRPARFNSPARAINPGLLSITSSGKRLSQPDSDLSIFGKFHQSVLRTKNRTRKN